MPHDAAIGDAARGGRRERYEAAVRAIRWFHCFDFGDGLYSQDAKAAGIYSERADLVFHHGIAGKTVLDIGAWDGYFAFEAERRGAARVLATDHYCWSGPGWGTQDGFLLAREILGSGVEDLDIDIAAITPQRVGTFDVVLLLGLIYHVEDPLAALRTAFAVCREYAVVETALDLEHLDRPALSFVRGSRAARGDIPLGDDPTNVFGPNSAAVVAMLEHVGFARVEKVVLRPRDPIPRGVFYAFK